MSIADHAHVVSGSFCPFDRKSNSLPIGYHETVKHPDAIADVIAFSTTFPLAISCAYAIAYLNADISSELSANSASNNGAEFRPVHHPYVGAHLCTYHRN